jgi:tetratricopeptide (TPR) repeat protein
LVRAESSLFSKELERLLAQRNLSWRKLSKLVGYTPGWLSKIKNGVPPSADLARRCDEVLEAGGQLIALASAGSLKPGQLPATSASFVGREDDLRRIRKALTADGDPGTLRAVSIEGPPGVGKTALALRAAHDAACSFSDGHLYVDLHGYSSGGVPMQPEESLEELLGALDVPPNEIPVGVDRKAALFRSILAERHVLVVLDNAANFRQIEHLLPGASGCAVVVTSRNRLSGLSIRTDSVRIVLGPLTSAESANLLRGVIGADRTAAEAAALDDLAERCAYLPLALRIAADHVLNHPENSLAELVAELPTADAEGVRKVFSWSYRTLDEATARMFRLLSLHPGHHVCVAAAAALTGLPVGQAQTLVSSLAGMHLVEQVSRDRYQLHDLLKSYGQELVGEQDCQPAVRRLTDWYLHTAVAANESLAPFRLRDLALEPRAEGVEPLSFSDPMSGYRWCAAELPNFVPISRLAVRLGLFGTAWRLPIALFDYLLLHKPWRVWTTTHEIAQSAAAAADDKHAVAWVQTNLAVACRWLRDFERCEELYAQALAVRQEIGDLHGQAWIYEGAAALAMDRGQVAQAKDAAHRALEIFGQLGDREGQAAALVALSEVYLAFDRPDEALTAAQDALAICEDLGDLYGQGRKLVKIADIYVARGEPAQALEYVNRSLEVRRQAADQWGEADALALLGDIERDRGRLDRARVSWQAALELFEQLEDPRAVDVRSRLGT